MKFENVLFIVGGDKMNCYDIYKRIFLNCEIYNFNVGGLGWIWLWILLINCEIYCLKIFFMGDDK